MASLLLYQGQTMSTHWDISVNAHVFKSIKDISQSGLEIRKNSNWSSMKYFTGPDEILTGPTQL